MKLLSLINLFPPRTLFRIVDGMKITCCETTRQDLTKRWPKRDLEQEAIYAYSTAPNKLTIEVFGAFTPIEAIENGGK